MILRQCLYPLRALQQLLGNCSHTRINIGLKFIAFFQCGSVLAFGQDSSMELAIGRPSNLFEMIRSEPNKLSFNIHLDFPRRRYFFASDCNDARWVGLFPNAKKNVDNSKIYLISNNKMYLY